MTDPSGSEGVTHDATQVSADTVNRRMKGVVGWLVLLFVFVGLLAYGATRDSGPRTPDERIESITKRIACPVCQGESVYESRNNASEGIRTAVREEVALGAASDDEIVNRIVVAYNGEELLVPTADGIEALAWALPATAFVVGVAGLTIAFRRWRASSDRLGAATDDDYALVAAALDDEADDEP
jgi:cytochrome c-type biogenesis protein CcmH